MFFDFLRRRAIQSKRLVKGLLSYSYISRHVKHISGPQHINRAENDCVVVSLMRNSESYIAAFIDYHLELGFTHVFLLDNGSEDTSIQIASQYASVSIYQCLLPYGQYKDELKRYLVQRFSFNHWCLIADVDEFFNYPGNEHLTLKNFIEYLNKNKFNAVLLQMLDMYPNVSILSQEAELEDFKAYHRWFEIDSISRRKIPLGLENEIANPNMTLYYGGVRKRVFNSFPLLSKFCLLKPGLKLYQVNHHLVSFADIADISCLLCHYKFLKDFSQVVSRAVSEQQYYEGSVEYKNYQAILKKNDRLSLISKSSLEFKDVHQLVDLNFLDVSPQYLAFCRSIAKK